MKTFRLSIVRKSQVFDAADIEAAFAWVRSQIEAADVADCEEVSVKRTIGLTEINCSMITTPDPPAPAPAPAPEPEPEPEPETSTTEDPATDPSDPTT